MKFIQLAVQAQTVEQAVNEINDSLVQGFEEWTPEMVAANHALDGINDAGMSVNADEAEFQLEHFSDAGAVFDMAQAIELVINSVNAE